VLGTSGRSDWWMFFGALLVVFALHNVIQDKESKAATFLWLAWFRFMAPVIFIIQPTQRMGVAMGAVGLYAAFRLFGYLDSKGLLEMPGRQSMKFRVTFFLVPLSAALATLGYDEAAGFRWLVFYFASIAAAAYGVQLLKARLGAGR
jgi:hypothetical protein